MLRISLNKLKNLIVERVGWIITLILFICLKTVCFKEIEIARS